MSDEPQLRRLLSEAIPTPPAPADRVGAARRRARHHAVAWQTGCAFLVVIAVTTGLVVAKGPHDQTVPAKEPLSAVNCSKMMKDIHELGGSRVLAPLEPGVERGHLCATYSGLRSGTPNDDLKVDARRFARWIDRLPPAHPRQSCRGPGLNTFAIVFSYASGPTRVAWLDTQACGAVVVDGVRLGNRFVADNMLDRYLQMLGQQRDRERSPKQPVVVRVGCGLQHAPSIQPPQRTITLTRAVACVSGKPEAEIGLDDTEAAVFSHELESANLPFHQGLSMRCTTSGPLLTVVAQDVWGSRYVLTFLCEAHTLWVRPDGRRAGLRAWVVHPDAKQLVYDLRARALAAAP